MPAETASPGTGRFITVRDLVENKFRFMCHTSTLRDFAVAIRQRQLILNQLSSIPMQFRDAAATAASHESLEDAPQAELDAMAICLYHYLKYKFWENHTELREATDADYEDDHSKQVRIVRLKHPIASGCIAVVANVGTHTIPHQAFALLPAGALYDTHDTLAKDKENGKLSIVNLSDRKFQLPDELDKAPDGEWKILVDARFPKSAGVTAVPRSRLVLRVELKARSSVLATVLECQLKLPPLPQEEDDILGPIQVGEWTVVQGYVGVPPLARDPKAFSLPKPEVTGDTLPDSVINPPEAPATAWAIVKADDESATVEDGKDKATAAFEVVTDGKVSINQDTYRRDGNFSVYAFAQINISAREDAAGEDGFELKLRRGSDGKSAVRYRTGGSTDEADWKEGKAQLGMAYQGYYGDYDFSWSETDSMTLPPSMARIALRLEMEVSDCEPGSNNWERAQLPVSFKAPLEMQFFLTDGNKNGVVHRLTFGATNKPLDVATRENALEKNGFAANAEVLGFVSADDVSRNTRDSCAAFFVPDTGLVIKRSGYTIEVDLNWLQRVTYTATKNGHEEELSSDFATTSFPKYSVTLLVNREYPPTPYGIRLTVETETSKASEAFYVRLLGDDWIAKSVPRAPGSPKKEDCAPTPTKQEQAAPTPKKEQATPPSAATPEKAGEAGAATEMQRTDTNESTASTNKVSATLTTNARQASMTSAAGFTVMYTDRLGQGANGAVYRGYNNAQGTFIAVKESLINDNPQMRAAIAKEFATLTKLTHDNIVDVYALEIEGAVCRIFMEWLPSGSLRSVLSRTGHRMHEGAIRRYFRDALKGLDYLHSNGMCHLDIKPANMLLTANGVVKLADFGTSRLLTRATPGDGSVGAATLTNFVSVGTPVYMPPEMITKGRYYEGSDMWALACSIVELASGKLPWSGQAPDEVLENAIPTMFFIATQQPPNHHPTIPTHVSAPLRKILERCFNLTIASRPSAKSLLADDYFASDSLPLDAEAEDLFAKNTVAAANAASASAASTGTPSADPSLNSWTSAGTANSIVVVSGEVRTADRPAAATA
jgi:serine/threonine protein kinase